LDAFTGGLLDEYEQVDVRRGPWFDERTLGACPTLPFYCGEQCTGICFVLSPEKPSTYQPNTPPVFPGLRSRIWPHLLRLVTKAMWDRLLPV